MIPIQQQEYKAIFDIRPEVIAAALMFQDPTLEMEQIIMAPLGAEKRRSGKEVQHIQKRYFPEMKVWQIGMARKGLFDTLPEGLFLSPEDSYSSPIEKSKAITKQIADARRFFLPFEQYLYWPRIEIEQTEQRWTETFPSFLEKLWGIDDFEHLLDARQRLLLCYLIPMASAIAGNWPLTTLCFEALLNKEVTLDFGEPRTYAIADFNHPLQETRLGETTVIGSSFRDDLPVLQIHVYQIDGKELDNFLDPGGMQRVLEELLYPYFIPFDIPVDTKFHLVDKDKGVFLGQSALGYGTILEPE